MRHALDRVTHARAERTAVAVTSEASAAATVPPLVLPTLPEEPDSQPASAAVETATLPCLSVDLTTENTEASPGNDVSACASDQPKESGHEGEGDAVPTTESESDSEIPLLHAYTIPERLSSFTPPGILIKIP